MPAATAPVGTSPSPLPSSEKQQPQPPQQQDVGDGDDRTTSPAAAAAGSSRILSPLSLVSLLPLPSLQTLLLSTLSLGPVPRHIAFVMDGNRRWATSSGASVRHGHLTGFHTLKNILGVCLGLRGLDTVSVYAFAIDNFKRDAAEVDALMEIARTRLLELVGHGELVARHKVRVRVVGRKELLPPDVRAAVDKIEHMTRDNRSATLNICMPYASRDEMAGAVRTRVEGKLRRVEARWTRQQRRSDVDGPQHNDERADDAPPDKEGEDDHDDGIDYAITPHALTSSMQLAHSPPLDILVRTSGVSRLSDFMLWQCNEHTHLRFVDKFWPQFGLEDMVPIILDWQRHQLSRRVQRWVAGGGGGGAEEE